MKIIAKFRIVAVGSVSMMMFGTAMAQISVFLSPNDVQSAEASGLTGISTETFNSRPTGTFSSFQSSSLNATYTAANGTRIIANDQYGGFALQNYLGVTPNASATVTLSAPAKYFGFYFTAADNYNNKVALYSQNTLVFEFNTSTLLSFLPRNNTSTVTALSGATYRTIDYYGQPTTNANSSEPYAYVHFVASGTTSFDRVVLTQGSSAIFESDNHSLSANAPLIPTSLVQMSGPTLVPEPSTGLLTALALGTMLVRRRR